MTRQISKSRSAAVVRCCMDNDPLVQKRGFRAAVHAVLPEAPANFLPDAFAVRPAERVIDLIEVVDTNPIMRPKSERIALLWHHASLRGWSVIVVAYDSCGGLICELSGQCFYPAFLSKFMCDDQGNAIPAAMAVARELSAARAPLPAQ